MKKSLLLASLFLTMMMLLNDAHAQRTLGGNSLNLDNDAGLIIKIIPPPNLLESYTWYLPPKAPPQNTAFTEAGILDGQTLRWNDALGYYTPTSTLIIQPNGELTVDPGVGNSIFLNNINNDDGTVNFLTIDGSNRIRYRSFSSILGVNANEGLVYDSPNIKLGATDGTTNPFVTNRFVNLNNNSLTFTTAGGGTSLFALRGSDGNVGIGTVTPNTFKLEVAGSVGPTQNNLYTLGTVSKRYKDLYLGPSSLFIGNGAGDQTKQSYSVASSVSRLSFDIDDNGTNDVWMEETGLVHMNGDVDANGHLTFGGDLKPDGNSGTSGQYLKSNGSGTTPTWTSITQSAWGISGNDNIDSNIHYIGTNAGNNQSIVFKTNGVTRAMMLGSTGGEDEGAFIPYLNNTYQLGSEDHRWVDVYVGPGSIKIGGFIRGTKGSQSQQTVDEVTLSYSDGNLVIDKPVANFGSMVPNTNNILELGSSSNRWKDIWLGPNSIHIGSPSYEGSISYDPAAKELKFNSNNTILTSELKIDSAGNLIVLALSAGGLLKANGGGMITLASGGTDFEAPLTFNNGLTRTVNNIALGGALGANTTVTTGAHTLTFTTLSGDVSILPVGILSTPELSVGSPNPFFVNANGEIASATGISSSGTVTFSGLATGVVHSTAGVLSSSPLNLAGGATEVSGILGVANGGTGLAASGSEGDILTIVTGVPAWQSPSTSGLTQGTGTAGNLAMWSSSNELGDAPITSDDGEIGIDGNVTLNNYTEGVAHLSSTGLITSSPVDLEGAANEITGILEVANGGTGLSSVGSDGTVFTVVTGNPTWQALSTGLTLTGNGTTSPFGINLGNTNSWSAAQTFSSGATVGSGLTLSSGAVLNTDASDGNIGDILTSQGSSNSPQWKSLDDLSIVTGSGNSGELTYWNGSSDIISSSNLTFDGASLSLTDAHLTSIQTTAPTEAEGANIGTGGTSTLANATDVAGKITIATGTGPAAGLQTTITFDATYNVAPIVTITPMNAASAAIQAYVTSTATTFTVSFGVAPAASTTYEFFYHVIETP